jgi:hypothetical protein
VVGFIRQGKGRLNMRIANKIHITKNRLHFYGAQVNGTVQLIRKYSRKTIPYEKYYVMQINDHNKKPLFLYKITRMSDKKYNEIKQSLEMLYTAKPELKKRQKKPEPELVGAGSSRKK